MRIKKSSVSEIKAALTENGESHFFDPASMKWFGDRMASFATILDGDVTVMYRKPGSSINVFGERKYATFNLGFNCWVYRDGALHPMDGEDDKKRIWDKVA